MSMPDRNKNVAIGIVNNMPDSALEATERQFLSLIEAAAGDMTARVKFYALPDVPRSDAGRLHAASYSSMRDLLNDAPDGLIVTGTEPRAADLMDEPYWNSLTRLVEWADQNTTSAIWSCLATHAAVLYMDGVRRQRLGEKRFGVFDCIPVAEHELTVGLPLRFRMPHSRWNDLPEQQLTSTGYRILTRSSAGVDAFVKQRKSLFVFFQGHPEYESETLLLEYRRDLKRFLTRESEIYPTMPQGYFDDGTLTALTALRDRAFSYAVQSFAASAFSMSSIKAGSKRSPRARKASIAARRSGTLLFWLNLNFPTIRSIAIEKTTIWFVICFRNSERNSEMYQAPSAVPSCFSTKRCNRSRTSLSGRSCGLP